jgi:hypothetical protein
MNTVLAIIALMTILNARTDVTVIHAKYSLSIKDKLLLTFHHFVILFMILGVFFKSRRLVRVHLGVVVTALICWFMFGNSCFLADWQRNSIRYTDEDLQIIHKSRDTQLFEFFSIVIPLIAIDILKLKSL